MTPTSTRALPGFVTPESMTSAARYISREWGETGYVIRHVSSWNGRDFYEVRASDGSTFAVSSNKDGHTQTVCEGEDCMNKGTWRPFTGSGTYLCPMHALDAQPARPVPAFTRQ